MNTAPKFSSSGFPSFKNKTTLVSADIVVNLDSFFSDDEGDALTYSIAVQGVSPLPAWASLSGSLLTVSTNVIFTGKLDITADDGQATKKVT